MTFIAFSDQHLESKLYNIPELEKDNRTLFSLVIDTAIEREVDYLVSVGDLFDNNKPSSDTIRFVTGELERLKKHNVKPVAIAGDHSKPVYGSTWEQVCGFEDINTVAEFAGVDYSDNPQDVVELLNHELRKRDKDTVEFLFMHQQIPELWPFCDEKKKISLKDLDLGNHCGSMQGVFLGDIHIRREMRYHDIACDKELFVGYCGSLGVTAANETEKPGLYYYDGEKLKTIKYDLPRQYVTLNVTPDNLEETARTCRYDIYKLGDTGRSKPVLLVKLYNGVEIEGKLNFLYDIGHVKMTRVRSDAEGKEELVNIRSEIKTMDRFSGVLRDLTNGIENSETVYDLAYKLLTSADPKSELDTFKTAVYEPQIN